MKGRKERRRGREMRRRCQDEHFHLSSSLVSSALDVNTEGKEREMAEGGKERKVRDKWRKEEKREEEEINSRRKKREKKMKR